MRDDSKNGCVADYYKHVTSKIVFELLQILSSLFHLVQLVSRLYRSSGKEKEGRCIVFSPSTKKKCIFTSIERELHVSTSYEFLSFSEPISQDFYPQPTSIHKQSVSSVKLTRNQTRVRSTTQCQLFFFSRD